MTEEFTFTAIYEPVEEGWVQARIKELPEVITAAPSFAEAKGMLIDALREYLLSLADSQTVMKSTRGATKELLHVRVS